MVVVGLCSCWDVFVICGWWVLVIDLVYIVVLLDVRVCCCVV